MQHFFFLDLSREKRCSILVFGNVRFNKVVRINHDNVASRGAVGCTHTIIRFQTRIRRDDETENFEGFVYVLDGFPQRDFALWVFMYPINISPFRLYSVSILYLYPGYHAAGYHAPSIPHGLSRLYHHCTATTPVYIFPGCLLYTSPSPRDGLLSRMPSSA